MKTVCINQLDDGSFTVELEGAEGMPDAGVMPEGMPEMPVEMEEPAGEAFASIDEALDAARGMFDSQESAEPLMEGEAEFKAGFDNARGERGGF